MFIKRTHCKIRGKTYYNHLLVESVSTPKGPRHKIICSLGKLDPGPREEWLGLARRVEAALTGQEALLSSEAEKRNVEEIVSRVGRHRDARKDATRESAVAGVRVDDVEVVESREAGPVHVGHHMWQKLGMEKTLSAAGMPAKVRQLTEVMVLNRLVRPCSEHATPGWAQQAAVGEVLGLDTTRLNETALYRTLDLLHVERGKIEKALAGSEKTLFNLDDTFWLYDLTTTYFEGECARNEQAKRGFSRDSRPDCKQVVIGLALGPDGFPRAHEVFDGNRSDVTTVAEMLSVLEERTGVKEGATVIVDRGMSAAGNLKQITDRHHHYLVASRQEERLEHAAEFESEKGWREVNRECSPGNPSQKKSRVSVKRIEHGGEALLLCKSEGRTAKDCAIREKQEQRMLADLDKLKRRIGKGQLRSEQKVGEAIGRLRERYTRVMRYYQIEYDHKSLSLSWSVNADGMKAAKRVDGGYILKTDRTDLKDDEVWKTYIMLTRVESAFRTMKSPLCERPIFHHLKHRVQTHIFLCVLAYHLLTAIETTMMSKGVHTSWCSLRQILSTHQVVTVVLPNQQGRRLSVRTPTKPEQAHSDIYSALGIPAQIMKPVKSWSTMGP